MKKPVRLLLHLIITGVVSVAGFLGFKKGIEKLNKKLEEKSS